MEIISIILSALNLFGIILILRIMNQQNLIVSGMLDVMSKEAFNNEKNIKKMTYDVERLDRNLHALKTLLDVAKPIKPNNWDSVQEAFKRPVRVDNVGT